jgi:tRNA 2-selenouridine synthase
MAVERISIESFLELRTIIPVADVRSPSEYATGHIPGAVNIPLFTDIERDAVGRKYKREGRKSAILEGLERTGPSLSSKLEDAYSIANEGKLLVYCWRGGMRSEAMAWLFSTGDISTFVLEGGYKSYRHYILEKLSDRKRLIILGGLTGSSKTHILRYLSRTGEQIIDLEGLANHKGSAFGSLGQPPQPSSEHFANLLYDEWKQADPCRPLWIEDESRNIGSVFMPENFYNNMQEAATIIVMIDRAARMPRLLEEYSTYPPELLKASVMKISRRLGGDRAREATGAIETGDFSRAAEIILSYYDKAYMFGLKKKNGSNLIYTESDTDNIETNAQKILDAAKGIRW